MNRLLLTATILAFFLPGIHAQNYNPKFDKAPDLTEFLKAAREAHTLQTCMPLPSIELEALNTGIKESKAGYVAGGPHHIIVTNSTPFQNALMQATLVGQHESQPAYALLARWDDIKNKRNELLSDAGLLNAKDSGLYDVGVQIDNAAAAFAKEKAALQTEINQYNQQCAGQPVSNYCTNWYNRLTAKVADYNRRVEIHNQKVKVWRINVQDLKNIVAGWRSTVQEWETVILDFIEDAKAFLANPNTGTCPPPPAPEFSEIHHVPPETPHFPCKGDHQHRFDYHQGPPPECKLRKVKSTICLDKSNIELIFPNDGNDGKFPGFRQPVFK